MSGFYSTGPRGRGPITGGGRGFCSSPRRNYWLPSFGRRDRAYYSRSWNMPFSSQTIPEQELDLLKNEATYIREELENIEFRIRELTDQTE